MPLKAMPEVTFYQSKVSNHDFLGTNAMTDFRLEKNHNYIGYLRVSTRAQGQSGLGLEAQREAIARYVNGDAKLLASYTEIESGSKDDRPELEKAMRHAKATGATLIVARLDRLSRDAHFLLGLQKAGVRFVCADLPEANSLTVGLLAILAQHERELISKRTKEALEAKRYHEPDWRPGPRDRDAQLQRLAKVRNPAKARAGAIAKADEFAEEMRWAIEGFLAQGIISNKALARAMNESEFRTRQGSGTWQATSVKRLRSRLDILRRGFG